MRPVADEVEMKTGRSVRNTSFNPSWRGFMNA
jgi:hypothetical protein